MREREELHDRLVAITKIVRDGGVPAEFTRWYANATKEEREKWMSGLGPLVPSHGTVAEAADQTDKTASDVPQLRRDVLWPVIDKAIAKAGTRDAAAIWVQLRELALNGEPPFTGGRDGPALAYTDKNNKPALFTPKALRDRLRRLK